MKTKTRLTFGFLAIWQLLSIIIQKSVLFPSPLNVLTRMFMMLKDFSFYQALFQSLSHIFIVIIICFVLGFLLAYLGYKKPTFDAYFSPIVSMVQSVPNVSFVFILLVWVSSLYVVFIVLGLVLLPMFYHNFIYGLRDIDRELEDVIQLYQPPFLYKLFRVYMPLIQASVLSSLKSALSLGIKVTVMAEVLAALPYGVGYEMNYMRIVFDMEGLFAWTLWLVVMMFGIDKLLILGVSKCLNNKKSLD